MARMHVAQELDHALKQLQSRAPATAVLFLSPDPDKNQVLCLAQVPEVAKFHAVTVQNLYNVFVKVSFCKNFLQKNK